MTGIAQHAAPLLQSHAIVGPMHPPYVAGMRGDDMSNSDYQDNAVEHAALYHELRSAAVRQIERIQNADWRIFQAQGEGPSVDMTDDVLIRERRIVAIMDKLLNQQ
jgi:hypothetical protein